MQDKRAVEVDRECVYLIRDNATGLHKIGMSTNWERRARQLQVGITTTKVRVVACKNAGQWERVLHAMFKHKRIPQSEWFRITAEEAIPKMEWLAMKTNQKIVIGNWKQAQDGHYYRRRKSGSGNWYTEQKDSYQIQKEECRQLELIISNTERVKLQQARREPGYWPTREDRTKVEWTEKDPTYTSVNGWVVVVVILLLGLLIMLINPGRGAYSQSRSLNNTYSQSNYETTVETSPAHVTFCVTGHNVNLRLSPDTTSAVISIIPIGLEVNEIERQGDWVHISYLGDTGEITGWINSSFLDNSENTVNIIKTKVGEGRKQIDTLRLEMITAEKALSAKAKSLLSLEEELKEKKSLPLQPDIPRIDLSSDQTIRDYTATQPEPDPTQEEIETLENQIQGLKADLKKASSAYKQKRAQYQRLKEFDDAYVDAYLKLSTTQDLQKLTNDEQVTFAEDTTSCGSLGCSLTIKDPTGRIIFSGMSQTAPYFLYYTPDGGFRSFIIKQRDMYSYKSADSSEGNLYIYNESQAQYSLSNDDAAAYVSKMELF